MLYFFYSLCTFGVGFRVRRNLKYCVGPYKFCNHLTVIETEIKDEIINVSSRFIKVASLHKNVIHTGSYMSANVSLKLLNELRKKLKCEARRVFYLFFATSLINLIVQEHEC